MIQQEYNISNPEEFEPFPKLKRLRKERMVITEKIDGTNAQVCIYETTQETYDKTINSPVIMATKELDNGNWMMMRCGSRKRWLTRDFDNFGFAKFVQENAEELFKLGEGRHFGKWWGAGIQRTYDKEDKTFSLSSIHTDGCKYMRLLSMGILRPSLHVLLLSLSYAMVLMMSLRLQRHVII